jgi:hypothetical protein
MKDWLKVYRKEYKEKLNINSTGKGRNLNDGLFNRGEGFEFIFSNLVQKKSTDFTIIETGTTRRPDRWKDGNSGFLFTEFVKLHGGLVMSVDLKKKNCETAKEHIPSEQYQVFCSDSVTWLKNKQDLSIVDLFYLDSYDVEWDDDTPSATHHLNEFLAIEPYIKKGSLVAIDDNSRYRDSDKRVGKGRMIYEYLSNKKIFPVYDDYQIIYEF